MKLSRRNFLSALGAATAASAALAQRGAGRMIRYLRYEHRGRVSYGVLEGETVLEIRGGLFDNGGQTGQKAALSEVKLLWPCEPAKMLAVGLNYKSHLGSRPAPERPEIFYKPTSALVAPGGDIVIPAGAKNVHYEGEIAVVIGRKTRRATKTEAAASIFGYTCGNDVSERDWQRGDLQWWRAKGADTFAPLGPVIVTAMDYDKARIQTRLNGEVKQSQLISDLLFDPPSIVSFVSEFVTLLPGDVIYTGTPGTTSAMKPGDVVEVEIDGIGVLRNRVTG